MKEETPNPQKPNEAELKIVLIITLVQIIIAIMGHYSMEVAMATAIVLAGNFIYFRIKEAKAPKEEAEEENSEATALAINALIFIALILIFQSFYLYILWFIVNIAILLWFKE